MDMKKAEDYWIYILECENGSYYTGCTNNLARRYRQHLNGTGRAKYTQSFKPIRIAQCWRLFDSRGIALRVEHLIKNMERRDKDRIVRKPETLKTVILKELNVNLNILTFNPLRAERESMKYSRKDD
jgi:putative endonuclease